jgi:hypothetical protein
MGMWRTPISLVLGLLVLVSLSCGCRHGLRNGQPDAGASSQEEPGFEAGTHARRPLADGGTCPDGFAPCGSGKTAWCVPIDSDPNNCGACGRSCAPGIACVAGVCQQQKCTGPLSFKLTVNHPHSRGADLTYGAYQAEDVNGDGRLDLVERLDSRTDGAPIFWLGQGDGTFAVGSVSPADRLSAQAAWDFNEDGLADAVVFDADNHGFSVRLRLSGGGWGAPGDSLPGDELAVIDVDGDGHLDVLAIVRYLWTSKKDSEPPPPQLFELLGHGDGTFASPRKLALSIGMNMRLLDWDSDGNLDLLFEETGLEILYGRGDGSFAESQRCPVAGGVFLDLNQDSRFDILWCPDRKRLATAFGQGGCIFTPRTDHDFSFEIAGFVMGDLDGDGLVDVLIGGRDWTTSQNIRTTALLMGRADGTFVRQPDLEIPWPAFGPYVSDVNGDGRADILTGGSAGIDVYANTCAP